MTREPRDLDQAFGALSDPTRRKMLLALEEGEASVGALADPFKMSLPTVLQHLRVLERAGLIVTRKVGRTRYCTLVPERMSQIELWCAERRWAWQAQFDRGGAVTQA
ncbi:MAG: metalloregulator ArsR/SmtB family transcription factor [Pseudomonadota bacterium]